MAIIEALQFGYYSLRGAAVDKKEKNSKYNRDADAKIVRFLELFDGFEPKWKAENMLTGANFYVDDGGSRPEFKIFSENRLKSFEKLKHVVNSDMERYSIVFHNIRIDLLKNYLVSEAGELDTLRNLLDKCEKYNIQIFSIENTGYSLDYRGKTATWEDFGKILLDNAYENRKILTKFLTGKIAKIAA